MRYTATRLVLLSAAVAALASCTYAREVRTSTVDVALAFYHDNACRAGPAGDIIRDEQRAEVYAATGVYVEADCLFVQGDTIDDFNERKRAADDAGISAPEQVNDAAYFRLLPAGNPAPG